MFYLHGPLGPTPLTEENASIPLHVLLRGSTRDEARTRWEKFVTTIETGPLTTAEKQRYGLALRELEANWSLLADTIRTRMNLAFEDGHTQEALRLRGDLRQCKQFMTLTQKLTLHLKKD